MSHLSESLMTNDTKRPNDLAHLALQFALSELSARVHVLSDEQRLVHLGLSALSVLRGKDANDTLSVLRGKDTKCTNPLVRAKPAYPLVLSTYPLVRTKCAYPLPLSVHLVFAVGRNAPPMGRRTTGGSVAGSPDPTSRQTPSQDHAGKTFFSSGKPDTWPAAAAQLQTGPRDTPEIYYPENPQDDPRKTSSATKPPHPMEADLIMRRINRSLSKHQRMQKFIDDNPDLFNDIRGHNA